MEPVSARGGESFLRNFISFEFAGGDRSINAREILKDDAAGAQIEVADFGVSHLAFGQTDIGAARAQFAAGIIAIELIVKRRFRQERGVAVFFRLGFAAGINAPAVANDQYYWGSHRRIVG